MISYLDEQVGRLLDALQRHGLDRQTVVFFTSDNGATRDIGGVDPVFFDSDRGLRGHKGEVYEGGIRVPMIVRWPDRIRAGTVSDHAGANWDLWPTIADLIGAPLREATDGVSIAPTLLGRSGQRQHEALYWEYHSNGSSQAVRMGTWKGVRTNLRQNAAAPIELYDLARDPNETANVAADHPGVVSRIERVMRQRTRSTIDRWNF
jgi:arylsulfatase A-like enzyme